MDDAGAISRRALVLGGGTLLAGGVAASVVGWNRIEQRLGLADSPDYDAPRVGAPVRWFDMDSAAMLRPVRVGLAVPPRPRAVVLCLHGRRATYRMAFDTVHMHHVVAAANLPIAVVSVNGGASSYWHKRASGIDPQKMIHDELWPRLDREIGPALPKAVMGWSMGGYGALLAAERQPSLYKAVIAVSPALFRSAAATAPGAFDSAEDYRRHDVIAHQRNLSSMMVHLDCGTGDPFIAAARAFAATLPAPNLGTFSTGQHDAPYWRSVAPAQVNTLAKAFGL